MKWDKESTVLSVGGGVALLVIGYLVWRHERNVQLQDNAAQLSAQQQLDQQQADQINAQLAAIPSYAVGGTVQGETSSSGGVIQAAAPTDGLQQILQAFYPSQPSASQSTGASGGASQTAPGTDNSQVTSTPQWYQEAQPVRSVFGAQPPAALPVGYDPTTGTGVNLQSSPGRINAHIQPGIVQPQTVN